MNVITSKTKAATALAAILVAGGFSLVSTTAAFAVSERVKQACKHDYFQFCPSYEVGSAALRQCMKSQGKNISLACRRALVSDGELPAKYAR